ncbi:hypothetical protein IWX87_003651 [Polaromonas sp. CG_9.7]|jgi:hypothetical protein|nr:hypothetical protein [Polaromonas sp. CG_9.7]MBG6115728.1 hypothetical protein [Polaromonas sp. CG_9.2]MDH6185921.1 hypothetical protein [Polaromonas sp. CG_23.6]
MLLALYQLAFSAMFFEAGQSPEGCRKSKTNAKAATLI